MKKNVDVEKQKNWLAKFFTKRILFSAQTNCPASYWIGVSNSPKSLLVFYKGQA